MATGHITKPARDSGGHELARMTGPRMAAAKASRRRACMERCLPLSRVYIEESSSRELDSRSPAFSVVSLIFVL